MPAELSAMHPALYEWDEAKRKSNLADHRVDFTSARHFDWTTAVVDPDNRRDYGERRLTAYGLVDGRLYVIVYTPRGIKRRIISFRKANRREQAVFARRRSR